MKIEKIIKKTKKHHETFHIIFLKFYICVFFSLIDRQVFLQNRCSYIKGICNKKNWSSFLISDGGDHVSPKTLQTDRRTLVIIE